MESKSQRLQKSELRPGMKVRHQKTGQLAVVANVKTNDHWSIPVIILNSRGATTDRSKVWKVKDIILPS